MVLAVVADEKDVDAVRAAVDATVTHFQQAPPDAARLDAVKKNQRYGFLAGMTTPNRVAGTLAPLVALTGGIEAVDTLFATLAEVSAEDVQTAAKTYLQRERRTVAVLKGGGR